MFLDTYQGMSSRGTQEGRQSAGELQGGTSRREPARRKIKLEEPQGKTGRRSSLRGREHSGGVRDLDWIAVVRYCPVNYNSDL